MSVVYLQRGWDHSAADRGSAGGSAGRPRSPCSLGLAPAAKRLYSAQHPGTGTPERNRLARGSPRPGAPRPPGGPPQPPRPAGSRNKTAFGTAEAGGQRGVPQPCPPRAQPAVGAGEPQRGSARRRPRRTEMIPIPIPIPTPTPIPTPPAAAAAPALTHPLRNGARPGRAGCRRPPQVGQVGGAGAAGTCSSGGRAAGGRRGGADYKPQGSPRPAL